MAPGLEIWDKEAREVLFIAPSYKQAPLKRDADPLGLEGFFPIPRPMLAIETPDTQTPIELYRIYKDQAEELDLVTRRITALTAIMKARGIYASPMSGAFSQLESAKDGDFVPADNVEQFMQGGLDNAVWQWPIDTVSAVLERLYLARDQIKATIFEITGVSDIQRGATNPNETLGAQRIKAEWGSLRLQNRQAEVQRYARDLVRLKADIIAGLFQPETIARASGIRLTPEQIQIMRLDVNRGYRVDIETDSTIAADTGRLQKNIADGMNAMAGFWQSMMPALESGKISMDVAADLFGGVMRPFKLGRQAEDALDRLAQSALAKSKQPEQAKPDPKVEAEKAKLELEKQRLAMDGERMKMDVAANQQKQQADNAFKSAQAQRDAERHALEMQGLQAKTAFEMQCAQQKQAAEQQRYMADQQRAEHDMMCAQEEHQNKTMAFETERAAKGGEGKALAMMQQLLAAQAELVQQQQVAAQQQQAAVVAAIQQLSAAVAAIGAPKRVVRDQSGRVAGVEPATIN